jgi:hypothetical protein
METPRDTASLPIPKEKADRGKGKTKNSGKDKFCCISQVSQTRTRSRLLVRQRKSASGE